MKKIPVFISDLKWRTHCTHSAANTSDTLCTKCQASNIRGHCQRLTSQLTHLLRGSVPVVTYFIIIIIINTNK